MKSRKTRRKTDWILRMLLILSLIMGMSFASVAASAEESTSDAQEKLTAASSYELMMIEDEKVPLAVPKVWEEEPNPTHMITWGLFWLTAVLLGLDLRRHRQRVRELETLMRVEQKKLRCSIGD